MVGVYHAAQPKFVNLTAPNHGRALWIRRALPERAQRLIKAKSGRSSLEANRLGVFRGFVSAYSQNDAARRCSDSWNPGGSAT